MVGNAAIDAAKQAEGDPGRRGGAQARSRVPIRSNAPARPSASAVGAQIRAVRSPRWWRRRWSTRARSPSRAPSPARRKPRAASIAAARSARPWASATPRRWSRSASMRRLAWSRSTRCGPRSTAATPSIRSRSTARSQGSVWMGMGQALCEETRYLDGLPAACQLARLSHADHRGIAADRGPDRRKPRSESDRSAPRKRAKARWPAFRRRLVNAIANAIGIDLDELPVTPDRVDRGAGPSAGAKRGLPRAGGRIMTALAARLRSGPTRHRRRGDRRVAASIPGSMLLAGGTDLLVNMRRGVRRRRIC